MSISSFMRHHYRHFNAAVCVEAAEAWVDQLAKGRQDARDPRRSHEHG